VRLGRRGTRLEYALGVAVAYLVVLGWVDCCWSVVVAAAAQACAGSLAGQVVSRTRSWLNRLKRTGQLHLVFVCCSPRLWLG